MQTENGEGQVKFRQREFKGSRFRCLLATSLPPPRFVEWLNSLIRPFAEISENDRHMPAGFRRPEEAKLSEIPAFLSEQNRKALTEWWLGDPAAAANTPNWDFVSTCRVEGQDGLALFEAKAHEGELKTDDRYGARGVAHRERISAAIEEVRAALGDGWSPSSERCYQLSNRFAWAWKVASLGVPVALVYLGFLNAVEMPQAFQDRAGWERCLLTYADGTVPRDAWERKVMIGGVPLIPLIRSADVNVVAKYNLTP